MTKLKLEIDSRGFGELGEVAIQAIDLALKYTATEVWGHIRRDAPVDHGRLAGSFQLFRDDAMTYRISTEVHYALHVHDGTGIYGPSRMPIRPTTARALSFYWRKAGKQMVVGSVAGQPGRKYTERGLMEAGGRTQEFIRRAVDETLASRTT